ncbi:MAG: T9SS type A sorting domain-containing protein, partial [Kordia sp.]|uniref:T9SS type A sorting domain-containing protein n=1 Tax=Kordia sp. TaxID=1965332 RepID=UPI0038595013
IFENNRVERGGVVYYSHTNSQTGNYDYDFTNCTFKNNLGRFATVFYGENPRTSATLTSTFINCSFHDNVVADLSSSNAGTNTLFWFRTDVTTTHEAVFINSTIANNSLNATSSTVAGVVSISRSGGNANLEMYNTVIWDNMLTNGNEQTSIHTFGTQTAPNSVTVANSLAPDGFSNWTNTTNIATTNPMFTDIAANNYTPMATSPATDTGDNSFFPSSILEDINGNARIVGGTIDMGAYEFDPTLSTEEVTVTPLDFTIYPNPAKATLHVQTTENIQTVSIFDMTGKQVLTTNETKIDVRRLQSGMYIIQVTSNQKNSTKRFIKQ